VKKALSFKIFIAIIILFSMGALAIAKSGPSLREQLEAASIKTRSPIFKNHKEFPVKFYDAEQMGSHAVYVKTQQPDIGSVNFEILEFDFKNGKWEQFGSSSNNYLFENSESETVKDTSALRRKINTEIDRIFMKKTAMDFWEAFKYQKDEFIKNNISKFNTEDYSRIINQYPILKENNGYSLADFNGNSNSSVLIHLIPKSAGKNVDAEMAFTKEGGVWKLLKTKFI